MIDLDTLSMRLAVGQIDELTDEHMAFARQLGIADIQMNTPRIPGDSRWEYDDLVRLRERADSHGLRLICLENVPVHFYDNIMLGLPGKDEQLADMQATVRNMGRAGIPILGYNWMPNKVWRSEKQKSIRGGAISNSFTYSQHTQAPLTYGREFTAEEMWANYDWYLERILPVCEEAGVRFALHPDDPPVSALGGIARIFGTFEGFQRAMESHPSAMHGLDYCHGCWSEMRGGAGILESIEYFGTRARIFYVHVRDVQGCAEDFTECFIDDGNSHIPTVVRTLRDVGFNGFLLDDHVPRLVNDSPYGHRGRAYALGYLRGILDTIAQDREPDSSHSFRMTDAQSSF